MSPLRAGGSPPGVFFRSTRIVARARARCYRLLREQGDEPELVIGLPQTAADKDAHAWVELDGVDVGPPPGRGTHEELARFK